MDVYDLDSIAGVVHGSGAVRHVAIQKEKITMEVAMSDWNNGERRGESDEGETCEKYRRSVQIQFRKEDGNYREMTLIVITKATLGQLQ